MPHQWPDTFDLVVVVLLLTISCGILACGYLFMFWDLQAWLRAARRVMIVVRNYLPQIPAWARQQTPRCLRAFGLRLPCTEAELLHAYRQKVKSLHPDKGGDRQKFMLLQADFEQSQSFLQSLEEVNVQ